MSETAYYVHVFNVFWVVQKLVLVGHKRVHVKKKCLAPYLLQPNHILKQMCHEIEFHNESSLIEGTPHFYMKVVPLHSYWDGPSTLA